MEFNLDILKINPAEETKKITTFVADQVTKVYRRDGIMIGLSGGIDSAVMAEIAVRSVGKDKVIGLVLPEKESSLTMRFL